MGLSFSPSGGLTTPEALGMGTGQGHLGLGLLPEVPVTVGRGEGFRLQEAHFLGFLGEMSRGVPGDGMSMGNMSTHSSRRP